MVDQMPDQERLVRELRRKRLTFAQRRKHLERLERAMAAERDDSEFSQRWGRAEFAVLTLAVAAILFGFVFWTIALDDSDSSDESRDLIVIAEATWTPPVSLADLTSTAAQVVESAPASKFASRGSDCQVDPFATDLITALPLGDPTHLDWYGSKSSALWVSPTDLTAIFPVGTPKVSSLWFAGQMTEVMWYGASLPIRLTGEQLDGNATVGPIESTDAPNQIQWTNFTIPVPGCWELTGSTGESTLTITVEVLPSSERPDIATIQNYYDARPYEAPASCVISPWSGPDIRGNSSYAHFWLEGEGISAEVPGLFIANLQQSMGIYGTGVVDAAVVSARNLDSANGEAVRASTSIWNTNARLASFIFTSPGCWELDIETPATRAAFVVYVYPAECEPELRDGEFVADCEPPRE